jgi:hypothetical protein
MSFLIGGRKGEYKETWETEAETGVMWPQATTTGSWKRQGRLLLPYRLWRECGPTNSLFLDI